VSLVSAIDTMKDQPKVCLMTVHSAKGLEFETVLLTGMEEEVFPYRGVESNVLEELDEERRLAYVAVTRARRRLFVIHAWMRTLFGQTRYLAPSRFLADLPDEVVRKEGGLTRGIGGSQAGAPQRETPRLRPGERIVDSDAFDDVGSDEGSGVRPGDRVRHARFGRGIVESVEQSGSEPTIVARFPGYGTRRIRAGFLELA
jgi:DNA helicase II / ATP-dependent DNA helicase PcrA